MDSNPIAADPIKGDPIAAEDLFGCDHRFLLDRIGSTTPILPEPTKPIGVEHRAQASRNRMEHIYLRLAEDYGAALLPTDESAAWEATQQAITQHTPVICGAYLPDDPETGRAGASCILMLAADGEHYAPVITVNHKTYDVRASTAPRPPHIPVEKLSRPSLVPHTSGLDGWDPQPRPELRLRHHTRDQLRLTHLWLLMQAHGIPATGQGGVIDMRGQCAIVHWLEESLPNYLAQFELREELVEELDDELADEDVESLTPRETLRQLPTRSRRRSECHNCGWWDTLCRRDLTIRDDVSLVVSAAQAEALAEENIHTVAQLAALDVVQPEHWPGGSFETAVALARASLAGFAVIRQEGVVEVPRADVEIDIDMESVLDDGAYLWGALLTYTSEEAVQAMAVEGDAAVPGYRPYVTWRKLPNRSTAECFVRLWQWVSRLRRRAAEEGLSCLVYCYAQAGERQWMLSNVRTFADYTAMPSEAEVRELVDGPHWVDVFRLVERQFVGVYGLGLKKVAPVAGFQWRDEEPSGEASIAWHAQAVRPGARYGSAEAKAMAQQVRARILAYNEDDVRATLAVREWLSAGEWREVLPSVEDLLADPPEIRHPS